MQTIPQSKTPREDYRDLIETTVAHFGQDVDNLLRQIDAYTTVFDAPVEQALINRVLAQVDRLTDGLRDFDPAYLAAMEKQAQERADAWAMRCHYSNELADFR